FQFSVLRPDHFPQTDLQSRSPHQTKTPQQSTRSAQDQTTKSEYHTRPSSDPTTIRPSDQTVTTIPDHQIRSSQQTTILDYSVSDQHSTTSLLEWYSKLETSDHSAAPRGPHLVTTHKLNGLSGYRLRACDGRSVDRFSRTTKVICDQVFLPAKSQHLVANYQEKVGQSTHHRLDRLQIVSVGSLRDQSTTQFHLIARMLLGRIFRGHTCEGPPYLYVRVPERHSGENIKENDDDDDDDGDDDNDTDDRLH
ncbi:unnamed protein product, partial [Porites lobata]